jgi:SH3 domain protein
MQIFWLWEKNEYTFSKSAMIFASQLKVTGEISMKAFLAIISFFSVIAVAHAETRYIVDQIKLPMRTGQSTSHSIVRMLPSGMAVEIIEEGAKGYTHIRTPRGKDGWMLTRYLMKMPAARDRLATAEIKVTKYNALNEEKKAVEEERARLQAENSKLRKELKLIRKTSAQALAIANENKALKMKTETAEQALEDLRQETKDIKSGVSQKWFMLGGGAILLGIILGLILPGLRRRKRSQWGQY